MTWTEPLPKSRRIHMVVVADQNFARRYKPIFDRIQAYADRHDYTWTILGKDFLADNFFFAKHAMVALWMENENIPSTDAIFVFDADVVPYRTDIRLETWADEYQESIVLYCRGWHDDTNEIAAGNYLVRNTAAGRDFLRGWALYGVLPQPVGFFSSDNGAVHLHLLRVLGFESWDPPGPCGTLYKNLKSPETNLTEYWSFVACTRRKLIATEQNQTYSKGEFTFRLLPKRTAWVEDFYIDTAPSSKVPGPVFHHGVKINAEGLLEADTPNKYNINTSIGVNCGEHAARTCSECPQGYGAAWCNGECHWCEHGDVEASILRLADEARQCVENTRECRSNSNR